MPKNRSKGRMLNGLLLFDKSSGVSSNRALKKVKRIFNAAKAGHTGTLDPLATGLLVICFGRATKISDYLLTADKKYQVTCKLGVTTTSGDADGDILEQRDASLINKEQIQQAASQLTGYIVQVPPMFSALKHQGKRLYDLARKGIEVERKPREICIHSFTFLQQQRDEVSMLVHCTKGTYVRTLVEDFGKALGCGAHITALRRIELGPFSDPVMRTLNDLEKVAEKGESFLDALLLPTDAVLSEYPAITVDAKTMLDIKHGKPINLTEVSIGESARIYDEEEQFYGIASANQDGKLTVKCLC